jgi:hypothetical protein
MLPKAIHLESLRMVSRPLILATVMLLIGSFTAEQAAAQAQNLEAGKSPSQIFAGTCSACHKSPRGLLKTVAAGSLPGFLRQHYTTSPDMANVLSSYLVSNGANDSRYGVSQKGGKDGAKDGAKETKPETRSEAKSDAKPEAKPDARSDQAERFGRRQRSSSVNEESGKPESEPRQAAEPDADGTQPEEGARHGRKGRRMARPAEAPGQAAKPDVDGQVPAQAGERAADGRKQHSTKQKLSKRSKPGGEDAARDRENDPFREFFRERQKSEPPKDEPASVAPPASGSANVDSDSLDTAKPAGDSTPQAAKVEPPRDSETPLTRPDPAPPAISAAPAPSPSPAPAPSTAASSGGSDPVSTQSTAASAPPPSALAPVAADPPAAPAVAPAGPPKPPVSQ